MAEESNRCETLAHPLLLQKEKKERKKSETEVEVDGTKELHVTLSPRTPAGDPPETEELIKALMVNIYYTNIMMRNCIVSNKIFYSYEKYMLNP